MTRVIAECCQNHNGDRRVLQEMIWAAAEAGADYAKIQSIRADELTYRERFERGENDDGVVRCLKRPYQAEYDRLKALDLDEETQTWFVEECRRAGVTPLTTVFTHAAVPSAVRLGLREVKVASYDCASYPLLRELRARFEHLFVSTGASYDHEIEHAAQVLAGSRFTFLHCVTIYPTPLDQLHLARMDYLRRFTPSVGFSDHTLVARDGLKATAAAMALGADVVERHFTVLPADATKDGPVSIAPAQLAELVRLGRTPIDEVRAYVREEVPEAAIMIGQAHRDLTEAELLNRDYYRGRFASRVGRREVFNWEDPPAL